MAKSNVKSKPVWHMMARVNGVTVQTKKYIEEFATTQTLLQESFLKDMKGRIPVGKKVIFAYKWGIPSIAVVPKPSSVDLSDEVDPFNS